jgi:hypothetical protein
MFPTDRLPAISALAAKFGKALKDEYKAGLWKSQLAEELLWRLDDPELLEEAPTSYQGPSWSWAVVNQPIKFCSPRVIDRSFEIINCETRPSNSKTLVSNSPSFRARL